MIGKATVPKWRYAFDCRGCLQIRELHDGVHEGRYCVPMLQGRDPIHADDDRVIRCDCWQPAQRTLFDEDRRADDIRPYREEDGCEE